MIKAVVFDMDGVLFDTEKLYLQAWYETAEVIPVKDIKETAYACIGMNDTDMEGYFFKKYGKEFPYRQFRQMASKTFFEILERDGLPMKPGCREILAYLKERRYPVALASSSKIKDVRDHIKTAGIQDYFQVVIGGDMVEHSKPHPEIYAMACEKLGMDPKDCAAVEDSYNGIRSAHAAGMMPVMVPDVLMPTPEIAALLFQKFDSLLEMKEYLERESSR